MSVASMLHSVATQSIAEYETAGEAQLAENFYRMRDDLDPDSYSATVAAHWAQIVPDKYKKSYNESVLQHMRYHSRSDVPNYSVGTRGLPFAGDQRLYDGTYRGDGLY